MIALAPSKPFQPTNRIAEKRDKKVAIYFTSSELVLIEREAAKRGTTIHNLVRLALSAIVRTGK